jgi:hypothetical protein
MLIVSNSNIENYFFQHSFFSWFTTYQGVGGGQAQPARGVIERVIRWGRPECLPERAYRKQ